MVTDVNGAIVLSQCHSAPARWLDCDDCDPGSCQLIVCVECGDTVVETECAAVTA